MKEKILNKVNCISSKIPLSPMKWSCIMTILLLTGCARDQAPAPVVSVNENRPPQTNTVSTQPNQGVGIVPLYPDDNAVSSNQNNSGFQPAPATVYVQPTTVSYNNVSSTSVQQQNTRNYNQIPKGSFSGTVYTVAPGDTLFYVSWITGTDVNELARLNNLTEPYNLRVGQQLNISNQVGQSAYNNQTANNRATNYSQATNKVIVTSDDSAATSTTYNTQPNTTSASTMSTGALGQVSGKGWRWPTQGTVIQGFSLADGGIKGLDIVGQQGQPIYASKAGKVVYAGDALAGYGNLIIINHDENHLSAYAHNQTLLVNEGDEVQGGQQIGTMGSTGTDRVKLYFEIREKGVPTDPIKFLPAK